MSSQRLHAIRCALVSAGLLMLAGCGGGDDDPVGPVIGEPPDGQNGPAPLCQTITGGGSSVASNVDSACSDCEVHDVGRAADANLDSGAIATAGNHPGACTVPVLVCDPPHGFTIRATAQPGVIYPAGMYPGAYWKFGQGSWTTEIRTYLGGALQEGTGIGHDSSEDDTHSSAQAFKASKPFDAVEIFLANEESGAPSQIEVRELCWDIPFLRELDGGGQ